MIITNLHINAYQHGRKIINKKNIHAKQDINKRHQMSYSKAHDRPCRKQTPHATPSNTTAPRQSTSRTL